MAQYEGDDDYITGGAIDDTPDLNLDKILDLLSPSTAAPVSTGVPESEQLSLPEGKGNILMTPITEIPGLSAVSRTIGSVARTIDNILPTTPLDSFIPDVETLAYLTPGVGDLDTGEYSILDMLGVGLDAVGIGAAIPIGSKLAKGKKAVKLTNPNEMPPLQEGMIEGMAVNPTQSIIARNRRAAERLREEQVPGFNPSPEVRARLDEIGAPSNEEFARMQAQLDSGMVPEGVTEGLSPDALRLLDEEAGAVERLQESMGTIKYEDFNIDQMELFDVVGTSGGAKHRYFRGDRANSNVIVELRPTGIKDEMRVSLTEGGHVNTEGVVDRMDDIGRSYLNYHINIAGDNPVVSGFHFYSRGAGKRAEIEAGRLIRDTMNHLPQGAIIDENILTMDSLYLLINQLSKKGRQGKMNIKRSSIIPENTRRGVANVSDKSMPSLLAKGGDPERALKVFQDVEKRLIKQGKLDPADGLGLELTMAGEKVAIKYNTFTISDLKAAIPMMIGVKDWEEFERMLDNEDDLVNSVIDLEQGIF